MHKLTSENKNTACICKLMAKRKADWLLAIPKAKKSTLTEQGHELRQVK